MPASISPDVDLQLEIIPHVLLEKPPPSSRRNGDFGRRAHKGNVGPLSELITTANLSPESAMVKFGGAMLGGMTLLE